MRLPRHWPLTIIIRSVTYPTTLQPCFIFHSVVHMSLGSMKTAIALHPVDSPISLYPQLKSHFCHCPKNCTTFKSRLNYSSQRVVYEGLYIVKPLVLTWASGRDTVVLSTVYVDSLIRYAC